MQHIAIERQHIDWIASQSNELERQLAVCATDQEIVSTKIRDTEGQLATAEPNSGRLREWQESLRDARNEAERLSALHRRLSLEQSQTGASLRSRETTVQEMEKRLADLENLLRPPS